MYFQGHHSYNVAYGITDAKLEIINDVSSAIDEIEQIVKQLNSAYRDMLVHIYSDETES